jgi:hypothetical protein
MEKQWERWGGTERNGSSSAATLLQPEFSVAPWMPHVRTPMQCMDYLRQRSIDHAEGVHLHKFEEGYNARERTGDVYRQIINHYIRLYVFTALSPNCGVGREKHRDPAAALTSAAAATPTSASPAIPASTPTSASAACACSPARHPPPHPTSGAERMASVVSRELVCGTNGRRWFSGPMDNHR